MNITELDSYRLADAVKFHNRLNPALWGRDEHLLPDVRDKLAEIAADFQEFLGVPDLDIKDITISGSNAAYNYTPNSDIDLHLVIDLPEADTSEVYRELFDAKKFQYNETHNITIGGYDVELYVQNPNQEHHSQGIYSLLQNDWISVPRRKKADIDDISTRSKYEDLAARIDDAVGTGNYERMSELMKKIRAMRQSGLQQQGEFGADNLAFKLLRNNGYIKRLVDARDAARDLELSLAELARPQQRVQYGFMNESPGGVSASTKMFLDENDVPSVLSRFFDSSVDFLAIENAPTMVLHNNTDWSENTGSFGQFDSDANVLHLATSGRHVLDILRTMAHELTHCRQNEQYTLPDDAGETGSAYEDQANAMAGRIMRHWADQHPDMFKGVALEESASGYIPKNKKQARDPRYSMALTVDIKPGQTGREANKLNLHTDSQGKPALLIKTVNLREFKDISNIDNNLSEIDRRGVLKAIGAGAAAAAVPGVAQAGPFVDVAALGKSKPEQAQKVWTPRYRELTARCQDIMRRLITAAGPKWAPLLKGTTIRVVSSDNYAQASAISRMIAIDLSVFWDAPDAALAFTIAHELGHIALEHGVGTDDESADYKTQLRVAAQYRQDELNADEFAVRICKVLGYNKAEVFKFIAQNEAELQMFDLLTQSPTSTHPSQKTRIERARMNGFQLSRGGIEQMNVLKQHLAEHDTVHSDLVARLSRELKLFEDQDLFEINMSPSNLKKLAAETGARAGMEFEMIVPDTDGGDNDGDLEPDYDQDERCRSIEDAVQFFDNGGYNDRREIQRLRERMENDFQEWLDDKIRNDYDSDGQEFVRDWIGNNVDESEWNPDDLEGTARAESLEEFADTVAGDPNNDYYQQAYDDYREENQDSYDESDWLDAEDLDLMSGVENAYDIGWPHWTSGGGEGVSIEEVADEFREAIGRKVNWSANYHGGKRESDAYVVEPDGSLEPDDSSDSGLEFVSPPLPIDDMISDLNKVKAWAKQKGCYTNDSTGLHINVSVPGFDNDKLDYVKLALLLGDQYVLDQFGRTGNTYAKSAMGMIKERIAQRPRDAAAMLQKMKTGMEELATKIIHRGTTSKYTSINTKEGYIEFRSPGGDWLNQNFDKIETTLLRFVVALDAAMDPAKYRDEYLKKLYRLLDPKGGESKGLSGTGKKDTVRYFADFVAGEFPKAALKSFIRQAQLERSKVNDTNNELKSEPSNYKIYQMSDGRTMDTFYAADAEQARVEFITWLMSPAAGGSAYDFNYAPINDRIRGTAPGTPTPVPRRGPAASTPRPRPDIIDIEPDIEQNFVPGSTQDIQQRRAAGGEFTGVWRVMNVDTGEELYRFSGAGNSQSDANGIALQWIRRNAPNTDLVQIEVVPVMS